MWKEKKKYDDLDTRSLIVNKENNEFRGVWWIFLGLLAFGAAALYDERLGYMIGGGYLTFIGMTLYNAHKK